VKFLLDHDVPDRIGDVLRQEGHDVHHLREVLPVDAEDATVWEWVHANKSTLVTCNRDDFLDLAKGQPGPGLLILIRRRSRLAECAAILRLIRQAGETGLDGNINYA